MGRNQASISGRAVQAVYPIGAGKALFVVPSGTTKFNDLSDMFPPDEDGLTRVYTSINSAIAACTANRGDKVYVAAGHTETVTAAGGITQSVAGVEVIGLGLGNDRPVVTFSTATTASWLLSGASSAVRNIIGKAGINALSQPFDVTASDVNLDIEWQDGSSSVEAARAVLATTVSRLKVKLNYRGFTAGSSVVNGIRLVGVTGADIDIQSYGVCTTAWVQFVTTASTNVNVRGYMYTSGITAFTRDVVDTVTGSIWFADFYDGSAGGRISGGSGAALASDDVSSVASNQNVPSADVTTNATVRDVVGNKTDASVYVPSSTNSLAAYAKGTANLQERVATKAAATITNGQTLFTVAGGPIMIIGLTSICITGNDGTASTLQYSVTPTSGSAQTISGASASLASALAGASVTLAGTALATAALLNANGPNLIANPGTIMAPAGTITAVVGVGSTTGTWAHFIRYRPLAVGVTVT